MRYLIILLLAGCSPIDPHSKIEGWPELRVIEHKVPYSDVVSKCSVYTPWYFWPPLACTEFMPNRDCHIWYSFDLQLDHEREHCQGMDHPGGSAMRKVLDYYRQQEK